MAKITFVSEQITVDVPVGTSIQDAVEKAQSRFPFGCRMGSCGTCRCLVVEGAAFLNALTAEEEALFETLTSVGRNERLGCQLVVQGEGEVKLKV